MMVNLRNIVHELRVFFFLRSAMVCSCEDVPCLFYLSFVKGLSLLVQVSIWGKKLHLMMSLCLIYLDLDLFVGIVVACLLHDASECIYPQILFTLNSIVFLITIGIQLRDAAYAAIFDFFDLYDLA